MRFAAVTILTALAVAASAEPIPTWRTPEGSIHFGRNPPAGSIEIDPALSRERRAADPIERALDLAARHRAVGELHVVSSRCRFAKGLLEVRGVVSNPSRETLEGVVAVASFRSNEGRVVRRAQAPIDRDPIGSGEMAGFEIEAPADGPVSECHVDFALGD